MRTMLIVSFTLLVLSAHAQEVKKVSVEKPIFNVIEEVSLKDQMLDSVFYNGRVVFNNGEITRAFLNYNLLANGIFFLNDAKEALKLVGLNEILSISYGKRTFIPIDANNVGELLLSNNDGTKLLLQRISTVKNNVEYRGAYGTSTVVSSQTRVNNWDDQGANYAIDKGTEIEIQLESVYLIVKNRKIIKLRKLSDLKKVYPDRWEDIRSFVSDNNIKLSKAGDVVALIEFCGN